MPVLTAVQLTPLLAERKRPPPSVPAKTLVPFTKRDLIEEFTGKPALTWFQLVPLFEEK
jgi:hypothetical protein